MKGIPSMIYYPVPLHMQNAYQYLGYRKGDFPVTEALCETVLSLPMHTEFEEEQLQFITSSVLEFLNHDK
jgi:UDP-2-acetamido-2-deoxy-ribo-hexuluronate aminotransferase